MNRRLAAAAALALTATASVVAADPARISTPYTLNRDVRPGDVYMGVEMQGTLKLDPVRVDGHTLGGLSALAFDEDEGVLYALSDGGVVFHLVLHHDESGFLARVEAPHAFALSDSTGRALKGKRADSEGLTLGNADNGRRGDTEFVVSFERLPRVLRFSPRGELLGAVALPPRLRDTRLYRSSNRGLESLAWHPRFGFLTAVEQPFKGVTDGFVELHALDAGLSWRYPLAAEPNAGLTEMLVLRDGTLLTLERGFGLFFVPFISSVRKVRELPAENGATLAVETIARFNTGQGWSLDNFEGLAALDGERLVMVSDDNHRALQATLITQLRLLPEPPSAESSAGNGTSSDAPPTAAVR